MAMPPGQPGPQPGPTTGQEHHVTTTQAVAVTGPPRGMDQKGPGGTEPIVVYAPARPHAVPNVPMTAPESQPWRAVRTLSTISPVNVGSEAVRKVERFLASVEETTLDLHGMSLTEVPERLQEGAATLTDLYLNHNKLAELPTTLGCLVKLDRLVAHKNLLTTLPPSIGACTLLTHVHLGDNELTALPECIGELKLLVSLNVRANKLTAIPATIGQCASLQDLSVQQNMITSVPVELACCTNLRKLNLAQNPLSEYRFPAEFGNLQSLSVLNLSRTGLPIFPKFCRELAGSLTSLDLSENGRVMFIPEWVLSLKKLENIKLRNNRVAAIDPRIFSLPKLAVLGLRKNPVYTDALNERLKDAHGSEVFAAMKEHFEAAAGTGMAASANGTGNGAGSGSSQAGGTASLTSTGPSGVGGGQGGGAGGSLSTATVRPLSCIVTGSEGLIDDERIVGGQHHDMYGTGALGVPDVASDYRGSVTCGASGAVSEGDFRVRRPLLVDAACDPITPFVETQDAGAEPRLAGVDAGVQTDPLPDVLGTMASPGGSPDLNRVSDGGVGGLVGDGSCILKDDCRKEEAEFEGMLCDETIAMAEHLLSAPRLMEIVHFLSGLVSNVRTATRIRCLQDSCILQWNKEHELCSRFSVRDRRLFDAGVRIRKARDEFDQSELDLMDNLDSMRVKLEEGWSAVSDEDGQALDEGTVEQVNAALQSRRKMLLKRHNAVYERREFFRRSTQVYTERGEHLQKAVPLMMDNIRDYQRRWRCAGGKGTDYTLCSVCDGSGCGSGKDGTCATCGGGGYVAPGSVMPSPVGAFDGRQGSVGCGNGNGGGSGDGSGGGSGECSDLAGSGTSDQGGAGSEDGQRALSAAANAMGGGDGEEDKRSNRPMGTRTGASADAMAYEKFMEEREGHILEKAKNAATEYREWAAAVETRAVPVLRKLNDTLSTMKDQMREINEAIGLVSEGDDVVSRIVDTSRAFLSMLQYQDRTCGDRQERMQRDCVEAENSVETMEQLVRLMCDGDEVIEQQIQASKERRKERRAAAGLGSMGAGNAAGSVSAIAASSVAHLSSTGPSPGALAGAGPGPGIAAVSANGKSSAGATFLNGMVGSVIAGAPVDASGAATDSSV